ncbi:MAG: hypothetical protein WC829_01020 [Hyphomicrobium sp.]|jgi:hypothetical protein
MSRSKRDILDTEAMLERLAQTLRAALSPDDLPHYGDHVVRQDAESLRRISMTLHRWHELECGDSNDYASWAIERDGDEPDSKPYIVRHSHTGGKTMRTAIPDRETGARKRLTQIMARYPTLTAYVQTDPRGCALYILRNEDIIAGSDISACYSRGLAVFQ